MNVLYLSLWYPYPPDNGSRQRVYHLVHALAQIHRVTFVAYKFGASHPEESDPLHRICQHVVAVDCNPFHRSGLAHTLRFFALTPIVEKPIAQMQEHISRLLESERFDLIICTSTEMAQYVRHMTRTPKVLETHNATAQWAYERFANQRRFIKKVQTYVSYRKRRRYDRAVFRQFDAITAVSDVDRAHIRSLAPPSTVVITLPNGVDCDANRFQPAPKQPYKLVFNGALTYHANLDAMGYFLDAIYPHIRAQLPDVTLDITGSTTNVPLASLKLGPTVTPTGYVDDIRPLVARASVCVVPLREGSGTRLKILEAMALGTCVVTTSKGAEGLNVKHGEHLLITDNPLDFAKATVQLLTDQNLAQYLAMNARQLVQQEYDWQNIGERFVELIETIC
jgi:polysaccharide biosynthesis protein PslH